MIYAVAVFAPLLGAFVAGLPRAFGGRVIGDRAAQAVSVLLMALSAIAGVTGWATAAQSGSPVFVLHVADWISGGSFHADWALRHDMLALEMVAMVSFISLLIHIYSIGYMSHETWPTARFFSYLSLFTFAMLMLVSGNNLIQLFFGWEGVGLASYLLIGYWYERPSANAAAFKAFVVNRVADLFFIVGIVLLYRVTGSVSYDRIFAAIPRHLDTTYHLFGAQLPVLEVIGVLLFIGAMGKSAQLFFHTWLPDAMEGPTPVSALIHAATMVTAGVFLLARMSPLLEFTPVTREIVLIIGALTAFFAATVGLVQPDIKRTIAYSTCSQLGYMFVASGVGVYQASIFHLTTHAFFKALLFLSAGSVIHAMHDEQDMFRMGGLRRALPVTYVVMWAGSLALAGIPPFAGWWSKDAIISAAWAAGTPAAHFAWALCVIVAFITALYSGRLLFLVFHGKPRYDNAYLHPHESGPVMLAPLVVLAAGAVFAGWLLYPWVLGTHEASYWNGAIFNAPGRTLAERLDVGNPLIEWLPTILGVAGFVVAWYAWLLKPEFPAKLAASMPGLYRFLLKKWYFDELYDAIFVRPYRALARLLWQVGDESIIGGAPRGLAAITIGGAATASRLQTGSIAVYAFTMLIGLVVLISTFLLFR